MRMITPYVGCGGPPGFPGRDGPDGPQVAGRESGPCRAGLRRSSADGSARRAAGPDVHSGLTGAPGAGPAASHSGPCAPTAHSASDAAGDRRGAPSSRPRPPRPAARVPMADRVLPHGACRPAAAPDAAAPVSSHTSPGRRARTSAGTRARAVRGRRPGSVQRTVTRDAWLPLLTRRDGVRPSERSQDFGAYAVRSARCSSAVRPARPRTPTGRGEHGGRRRRRHSSTATTSAVHASTTSERRRRDWPRRRHGQHPGSHPSPPLAGPAAVREPGWTVRTSGYPKGA